MNIILTFLCADGDDDGIPIVPITDEQEDAMEDMTFKSLLKVIGVKPPANEQVQGQRVKAAHLNYVFLNSCSEGACIVTRSRGGYHGNER